MSEIHIDTIKRAEKIRSCPDNLWFEGFVGIEGRIAITKLPENFGHENWEFLDASIADEPTIDIDSDMTNKFYIFKIVPESGFEYPHEHEICFHIDTYEEIAR